MSEHELAAAKHYGQRNLGESILAALRRMGKDPEHLQPDDAAAVDAFHIRGRASTVELAGHCALGPEHRVLDAGCGLGGTARYLALNFGCHVTGLDLTPEYVAAAKLLTEKLKLTDKVEFQVGSALEMPFEDGSFDVVWSEHAQMNIPDKARLYGEIHRVLKPGGRFAFHDVLQGPGGAVHYPVPWARVAEHSALIDPAGFRKLLTSLGFDVKLWEDKTEPGAEYFRERIKAAAEQGPPPLGLGTVIGAVAKEAVPNMLRNLEERRVAVYQGIVQRIR